MNRLTTRQRTILICVLLGAVTLGVFWPVLHHDFIKLDDEKYVVQNEHVRSGLTWSNVKWAFTSGYASNWHPLTWISHMVDVQFFGLEPRWHHFVNLLLHIANTILLFLLFQRLTGALWRSAMVGALFALHPLHVESVAWVAERKDVLSTLFFLLTLAAYVRYAELTVPRDRRTTGLTRQRVTWYLLTLVLFAFGLMSKPMLVTLPFVQLLLDVWPLKRFQPSAVRSRPSILFPLIREKLPFFALCIGSSLVTFMVQERGHSVSPIEGLPLAARLSNAIASCWTYLGKTFWPSDLAIFYPHPAIHSHEWPIEIAVPAALCLVAISLWAVFWLKRAPWFAVGWFWFLGTLVPVIGIVQVGSQGMADRYTYIPLIGFFLCAVWMAAEFSARRSWAKKVLPAASVLLIAACATVTRIQINYWHDDLALFGHALQVTEHNAVAHTIVGEVMMEQGDLDSAKMHFEAAIEADPNRDNGQFDLCVVLAKQGFALARQGKLHEAEEKYAASLQVHPTAQAYNGHGAVLSQLGKNDEALAEYSRALQLEPDFVDAHFNLGAALAASGRMDAAETHFAEVVRLKPDHARALGALGRVLATQGRFAEAKPRFLESLRLEPNNPESHLDYAMCLSALQDPEQAMVEYRKALALNDRLPLAYNNLAWMLATYPDPRIRNGAQAVEMAQNACRLTNEEQPFFLGTLAAAYAEAGRFDQAVATAERARNLAQTNGLTELVKRNEQLLELYRAGKAFHESAQPTP